MRLLVVATVGILATQFSWELSRVFVGVAAGLVTGVWWPPALVVPAVYLAAVVSASLVAGRHPVSVLRLLSVYPTLHLSWGVGFLAGPPPGVVRRAVDQDAS